jgi:phage baseplate assembly protein gpV
MQKSFWSNWFKPATASSRKWTLEELGELYDVLLRNGGLALIQPGMSEGLRLI